MGSTIIGKLSTALFALLTVVVFPSELMAAKGSDVVVAVSGTPEAKTADFVCDGIGDEVEINAAIAQAATSSGGRPRNGTVRLAAGIYRLTTPVMVANSGVTLVGVSGQTTLQAAPWFYLPSVNGVFLPAVITFVGVQNFACRGLIVDSATNNIVTNGIAIISDGPDFSGNPSTNGIIEDNRVFTTQAHNYSIWNVGGRHIVIRNNVVDGGSTVDRNSHSQEGIETLNGSDILIANNTIRNIGNFAITVGGVWDVLPNDSSDFVRIQQNTIEDSRTGIHLGAVVWEAGREPHPVIGVEVTGNTIRRVSEFGVVARSYYGDPATPLSLKDILISGNSIDVTDVAPDTPFHLHGARAVGVMVIADPSGTEFRNIVVTQNQIQTVSDRPPMAISPVAGFVWNGGPAWPGRIVISNASDFTISGNTVRADGTAALSVRQGGAFTLGANDFGGAMIIVDQLVPITLAGLGFASQEDVRRATAFSSHGAVLHLTPKQDILFLGQLLSQLDAVPFSFSTPSVAAPLPVFDSRPGQTLSGDFNGDGRDELLWRDLSGRVYSTTLSAENTYVAGALNGVSLNVEWHIAGVGDFDQDGFSDILWEYVKGNLAVWGRGLTRYGVHIGQMRAGWHVVGCGDFDGDGSSDILIRESDTGGLAVWWSNRGQFAESPVGNLPDPSFKVVGIGDFDGSGTDDLASISGSGQLSISRFSNRTITTTQNIGGPSDAVNIAGTGDVNGDGFTDIVFWHGSAEVELWMMGPDLSFFSTEVGELYDPEYYYLAGVGDSDGDGRADLTWLHSWGVLATWILDPWGATGFMSGQTMPLRILQ